MTRTPILNGIWLHGDCLDHLPDIPDDSVSMILTDPPYGLTNAHWDTALPLDRLWPEFQRITKPRAAIILMAIQPFTSTLIASNRRNFRYQWYWRKNVPTGFQLTRHQPMRVIEDVLVFSSDGRAPDCYPQGLVRIDKPRVKHRAAGQVLRGGLNRPYIQRFTNHPTHLLEYKKDGGINPTQKPVPLFEYLVRTYSRPGQTVLDATAGSGTAAIAAERAGRRWICIEKDRDQTTQALARIRQSSPAP